MFRKLLRRQVNLNVPKIIEPEINQEINNDGEPEPQLVRNLGLISLVFLGVSNSIGSGVYVLTGIASNEYAGPFVTLSYVLAGIACLITAFCYAEFSARVKDTSGSSYSFVYYSLGECAGFFTGWMLFTGALASISASAITWSSYLNAFTNDTIKDYLINDLHLEWKFIGAPFSSYLDVSAIIITIIVFLVSLFGLKLATVFNNILAIVNIVLLVTIAIGGFIYGDVKNLTKTPYNNGFKGVIKGSSVVFYAFLGFESSTFAINESINPARNIPLSLIISLVIITLTYCGAAMSLNLMVPFNEIDIDASYPIAFQDIPWMHTLVSIGPLISLAAALYIGTYAISRMAYSMSKDGLVFHYLSRIHPKTKIPDLATYTSLVITLVLTLLLDVQNLIGFANISGFLIYSAVCAGLLIVRYFHDDSPYPLKTTSSQNQIENESESEANENQIINSSYNSTDVLIVKDSKLSLGERIQNECAEYKFFKSRYNAIIIVLFVFFSNILFFGLMNYVDFGYNYFLAIGMACNLISTILLSLFKQSDKMTGISFRVPLVPLTPILAIILNNYLLMSCEVKDWLVFAAIMIVGAPVYFFYGVKNSRNKD